MEEERESIEAPVVTWSVAGGRLLTKNPEASLQVFAKYAYVEPADIMQMFDKYLGKMQTGSYIISFNNTSAQSTRNINYIYDTGTLIQIWNMTKREGKYELVQQSDTSDILISQESAFLDTPRDIGYDRSLRAYIEVCTTRDVVFAIVNYDIIVGLVFTPESENRISR